MKRVVALFRAVRFVDPPRNAVAILYADDYWLRTLVLQDVPATTLALFPTELHISFRLFARMLRRMGREVHSSFMPSGMLRRLYMQYVIACLDEIGAKIVLTFIDNSRFFHELTRGDPTRTYMAVQNGTRTLHCVRDSLPPPPHPRATISTTNLFCFGQRDVDLYRRHGHQVDRHLPVGSLVGGYYQREVSRAAVEREYDLCLVSQWHTHLFETVIGEDYGSKYARQVGVAITGMNNLLQRLRTETGLSMIVCPRNDRSDEEASFYRSAFGNDVTIARSDRHDFSTFRVADESHLVVAMNSTVLAERFSSGQKVLWCNVPADERFKMPEAGLSYFEGNDYSTFKQRVLELLAMPQDEYVAHTSANAHFINHYDPSHPPHEVIRAEILGRLQSLPSDNVQR